MRQYSVHIKVNTCRFLILIGGTISCYKSILALCSHPLSIKCLVYFSFTINVATGKLPAPLIIITSEIKLECTNCINKNTKLCKNTSFLQTLRYQTQEDMYVLYIAVLHKYSTLLSLKWRSKTMITRTGWTWAWINKYVQNVYTYIIRSM